MSIINHMIATKREKERIGKEITRNVSIVDEVSNLAINIECTKEIIIDNLTFDYFIRLEEIGSLLEICLELNVDYNEVLDMVRTESIRLLRKEMSKEEISEMSWDDVGNSLIRINKRLILSKVNKEYPDVYHILSERAKVTADKIIGGVY